MEKGRIQFCKREAIRLIGRDWQRRSRCLDAKTLMFYFFENICFGIMSHWDHLNKIILILPSFVEKMKKNTSLYTWLIEDRTT